MSVERLGRLVEQVATPPRGEPMGFVSLDQVESNMGRLDRMIELEHRHPTDAGMIEVQAGDVLFGKLRPYLAKSLLATHSMLASSEFIAIRGRRSIDPRWLAYLAQSTVFVAWAVATSDGVKMPRTSWDKLKLFELDVPDHDRQAVIADFLDHETAHIDALTARKRRMIQLLNERRWQVFEAALRERGLSLPHSLDEEVFNGLVTPSGWYVTSLGRCLEQLTNGYVGPTRDILQDEGVRYIQGLHIKQGRIDFERRPYYVSLDWHLARPRIALREDDILIVQTGDIGQVAVVPKGFGPASCHALLIARVRQDLISSHYLGAYLQSRLGYHSLLRLATGALHPHLEFGIRTARIIIPPVQQQQAIAFEVQQAQNVIDTAIGRLTQQIALLQERRQALITRAVTGQLHIPGAAA